MIKFLQKHPKLMNLVPWIFFLVGCAMVTCGFLNSKTQVEKNRQTNLVSQAYNRATNCFAATSPLRRTPDHVKECYRKAEEATGVKIEHYGDGR